MKPVCSCGGGCFSHVRDEWIPHAKGCSVRYGVVELTEEEMARQDAEAAALREVESPVYDPFTSPWADSEDDRRRLLARAGIPAPRPKDRPEPHELVEPERQQLRRGIRSARRLTPADYDDDGIR